MDLFVPVRCHVPELLQKIGKNQVWLADKAGITPQRITDYVHLRHVAGIQLSTAIRMSEALGCSVHDLFTWEWQRK